MKLFGFCIIAAAFAQLDYDSVALKGGKGKQPVVDKGPRECNGDKLSDSHDGSTLWKCKSRNPDNKNPHLTKRCKLKCKNGKTRTGNKKVYCKAGHHWVLRKSDQKATPGRCV